MLQVMLTLRDFLTEEELKFLPGRFASMNVMILVQNKGGTDGTPYRQEIKVFSETGTLIGAIENPCYIPIKSSL